MRVSLQQKKGFHFEGKGASGVPVQIDGGVNEKSKGASPMELILLGLGACNAMDIVGILDKQKQEIIDYKIEVTGEREKVERAKPFTSAEVKIILEGDIDPGKAWRAAQLSFEKYCSVSMTLEGKVDVSYSVWVNGKEVKAN